MWRSVVGGLDGKLLVFVDEMGAHTSLAPSYGYSPPWQRAFFKVPRDRGCELLYLPPYSPDLNPIEEAFSKVKRSLRVIGARTKEALVEAIGKALDAVGAWDARGFFTHCDYDGLEQQA